MGALSALSWHREGVEMSDQQPAKVMRYWATALFKADTDGGSPVELYCRVVAEADYTALEQAHAEVTAKLPTEAEKLYFALGRSCIERILQADVTCEPQGDVLLCLEAIIRERDALRADNEALFELLRQWEGSPVLAHESKPRLTQPKEGLVVATAHALQDHHPGTVLLEEIAVLKGRLETFEKAQAEMRKSAKPAVVKWRKES